MRSISSRGPIVFTYTLYMICLSNHMLHFQNHPTMVTFFFPFKMFYPPNGDAQHIRKGSNWYTYTLFVFVTVNCTFKFTILQWPFFPSKCFIPRREMPSISSRGPIVFTYVLSPKGDTQYLTRGSIDTLSIYCVSKSLEPFKNLTGFSIFFPRNVSSPEGRYAVSQ